MLEPAERSDEHVPPPARGVGIDVRGVLAPNERELLRAAGLDGLAPVEAWTVLGTSRALAYATHGLFRYFGKFPPPIARHLIQSHTRPGDFVLDPMAGSGTSAVEAASLERRVVARDVSPLALLLCRVKTTHLTRERSEAAFERVLERAQRLDAAAVAEPHGLRNVEHWFLPATRASLGRLRAAIEPESDVPARALLLAAFAATVRNVSRATTEQGRLFLDAPSAREDAFPTFRERFEKCARAVAQLSSAVEERVRVEERDAKEPARAPARFRLALVHPPYFNNYKYSAINALELAWLGFPPHAVRPKEIREAFKVGRPERAPAYVADLATSLRNVAAELTEGGTLSVMLGDTVIRDQYVDVTRQLLNELRPSAPELRLERVVVRVPRYTEASWVASQRRRKSQVGINLSDFILLFTKGQAA